MLLLDLNSFLDGLSNCRNDTFTVDAAILSNLVIHMELLSWKSVIDITGDKKILKKITKGGEGYDRPNEGSVVKGSVHLRTLLTNLIYLKVPLLRNFLMEIFNA